MQPAWASSPARFKENRYASVHILRYGLLGVMVSLLSLPGCGQMGPLYLPDSANTETAARIHEPRAEPVDEPVEPVRHEMQDEEEIISEDEKKPSDTQASQVLDNQS